MEISLEDELFKAFDYVYKPGVFEPGFEPKFKHVAGDNAITRLNNGGAAGTPYYGKDLLGKEIYLPITISYPDAGSNSTSLKDWNLNYAIISIDSNKMVVKTPMTERRGEVVELINTESYNINIKGFLINQVGNNFPEADVMLLKKVYETNEALWLKCALTDIFLGNDKVVITSMNFPEMRGVKNVRPFELKMISDSIFNLIDLS